ncbi:uncharacterized protein At1g76660-like [Rhodamnia argentea]|uniref:Uncharacterized protein At1g76660-like n=1 Tax=Rhodamnia argentea TaxID=178133 RepID=A0A8B8MTL2_9MYRT|nr:uncharacterized protein At1g76660-like [Rhodamnia argentea]
MGSEQNRFPLQQRPEPRKRWGGCWGAFSCFGAQKGGRRIAPASRIPEGNASATQPNGPQAAGLANHTTTISPSLLAPPSSPASFTTSALPSTAQSPNNCFLSLSANSPGGPSSTMFATGPYAHETQLVSPPAFSTFTTEPSTAPLTPPPELAHLTTPSSPDVPYAHYFSSVKDIKCPDKTSYVASHDLQAAYSLYPGSPPSGMISPISRMSGERLPSSFPEREFPSQWDSSVSPRSDRGGSGRESGHSPTGASRSDTNFFCPATFAEFYLDHNPPFPNTGGRLSVSKDSDAYSTAGNGNQNWQSSRSPKQDPEEIEAYRASFGFSADEIITTTNYVEIADVTDDSFTMAPPPTEGQKAEKLGTEFLPFKSVKADQDVQRDLLTSHDSGKDLNSCNASGSSTPSIHDRTDDEDVFSRIHLPKNGRKYELGSSMSDAEIDYRRGRSLREGKVGVRWHG